MIRQSIALCALSLLALANGQEVTCGTHNGKATSTITEDGMSITWYLEGNRIYVTATKTPAIKSWLAVGFSKTGGMVPGDAVIGFVDSGRVAEYDLKGTYGPGVTVSADQSLVSGASASNSDGSSVLTFSRQVNKGESFKLTGSANLIYAYSSSTEFSMGHLGSGRAGSFKVSIDKCAAQTKTAPVPVAAADSPAVPDATPAPTTTTKKPAKTTETTTTTTKKPAAEEKTPSSTATPISAAVFEATPATKSESSPIPTPSPTTTPTYTTKPMPTISKSTNQTVSLTSYPGTPNVTSHKCTFNDGLVTSSIQTLNGANMNWTIKGSDLHFTVVVPSAVKGWVAIGFTGEIGNMFSAEAFIGTVSDGLVEEYVLGGTGNAGVQKALNQTLLVKGNISTSTNTTTLTFVRTLSNTDTFIRPSGPVTLLLAFGDNATSLPAQNDKFSKYKTQIDLCTKYRPPVNLTYFPGTPKIASHTCSVGNGDHVTTIATNEGVTYTWKVSNGTLEATVTINQTAKDWFAVGFASSADSMYPSTVFIGNVTSQKVVEASLNGASPSSAVPKADQSHLLKANITTTANMTTLTFSRRLTNGTNGTDYINATGTIYPIYALGEGETVIAGGSHVSSMSLCSLVRPQISLTNFPGAESGVFSYICAKSNGTIISNITTKYGLTFAWAFHNDTIRMLVDYNQSAAGWFAVGFSEMEDSMVPATAIIGKLSTGNISEYELTGHAYSGVTKKDNQSLVKQGDVAVTGGHTILAFERTIVPGPNEYAKLTGETYIIFAAGMSEDMTEGHGRNKGSITTSLNLCSLVL